MSIPKAETKLSNPEISKENAFELASDLNKLLSNYMIVYQRLRNYHWNVVGGEFYDVHEKFEEEYEKATAFIDEVAERMRILGFRPVSTLAGYVEHAVIKENSLNYEAMEMVSQIVEDYKELAGDLHRIVKRSLALEDYGTDFLARKMLTHLEQKIWMFQSFVK